MRGLHWTHVEQPAAARLLSPDMARDFAAILFYDVPGIRFRTPQAPLLAEPDDALRRGFEGLLAEGKPLIFLHHAMAGWPLWDRYAETIGARFFYQPGRYREKSFSDSGYVFPVAYRAEPCGLHPILAGLEDGFDIEDELYLFELLEQDVVPLLRARYDFVETNFYSAANALRARMWTRDGWRHPPGCDLIAWARRVNRSPIVVIQCGNDAKTFANESFGKLLRNAIDWAISDAAATWAAEPRRRALA
jgi:hypothetical protein